MVACMSEDSCKHCLQSRGLVLPVALALLPKLREILLREGAPDAEIVQEARKCLLAGGGELMRIAEKSA